MLPCSEVHWKILPAVCRRLALCMENEGVSRTCIASALGTSQAAVSQYITGKRGAGKLPALAVKECAILARKFASGKIDAGSMDVGISMIVVLAKRSKLGKNDPCAICMESVVGKRKVRE